MKLTHTLLRLSNTGRFPPLGIAQDPSIMQKNQQPDGAILNGTNAVEASHADTL